jgi:hypothetical protein
MLPSYVMAVESLKISTRLQHKYEKKNQNNSDYQSLQPEGGPSMWKNVDLDPHFNEIHIFLKLVLCSRRIFGRHIQTLMISA